MEEYSQEKLRDLLDLIITEETMKNPIIFIKESKENIPKLRSYKSRIDNIVIGIPILDLSYACNCFCLPNLNPELKMKQNVSDFLSVLNKYKWCNFNPEYIHNYYIHGNTKDFENLYISYFPNGIINDITIHTFGYDKICDNVENIKIGIENFFKSNNTSKIKIVKLMCTATI